MKLCRKCIDQDINNYLCGINHKSLERIAICENCLQSSYCIDCDCEDRLGELEKKEREFGSVLLRIKNSGKINKSS